MAEWLCNGLQIRVQRFDSASGLHGARPRPVFGWALIPGSSVVEQAAVNRWVDGSNPSRGATMETRGQATIALPLVFLEFRLGTIGVPPMRRLAANRRHESGRIVPGATGNITHEANQRSTPPNEGTPRPAQGETQSQAPQTAGESTRVVTRRPWQTGRGTPIARVRLNGGADCGYPADPGHRIRCSVHARAARLRGGADDARSGQIDQPPPGAPDGGARRSGKTGLARAAR